MGSLEHCHWPRRDFVHIPVWNINWAFPDDPAHRLGAPVAGIESCDCRSSDREPGEMELASAGKARGQGQCAGPRLAGRNAVPWFPVGSVSFWDRRLCWEAELWVCGSPQPCQGKWHFSHYYIWRKCKQFEIVLKFSLEGL